MEITVLSNIGKKRASNQDYAEYYFNQAGQVLFVLCDGVGGNLAGDVASRLTAEYLGQRFQEVEGFDQVDQAKDWMDQMIAAVNDYILEASKQSAEYEGMGTTLILATLVAGRILLAHVGDSRGYLYRQGQLIQVTEDHSLVNELIKTGEITPEEGLSHPQRNVVTQSIGLPMAIEPAFNDLSVEDVDVLLLCSDGLTNMVTANEIVAHFKEYQELESLGQALIDAANLAGGKDNITLILVRHLAEKEGVFDDRDRR